MRPRKQSSIVLTAVRFLALPSLVLLCCCPQLIAQSQRGAIICREDITLARRDDLARKLQAITGWRDLNFDSNGAIRFRADAAEGGSHSARSLFLKTLGSDKVLILEAANNRPDVVFARVVPGRWKNDSGEGRSAFVVLVDFADFDRLMGDRPALAAFNVGWSLLHEIDHVVNNSVDSESPGHAGECEEHINEMRRECQLPTRGDYFYHYFLSTDQSPFRTRLVRLAFEQQQTGRKQRRFWIIWDATEIGGLEPNSQIAALK